MILARWKAHGIFVLTYEVYKTWYTSSLFVDVLLVMCRLRPEARGRAKPGQKKPGQAGPDLWPETAFGPACDFEKPEPAAWATAWNPWNQNFGTVQLEKKIGLR